MSLSLPLTKQHQFHGCSQQYSLLGQFAVNDAAVGNIVYVTDGHGWYTTQIMPLDRTSKYRIKGYIRCKNQQGKNVKGYFFTVYLYDWEKKSFGRNNP